VVVLELAATVVVVVVEVAAAAVVCVVELAAAVVVVVVGELEGELLHPAATIAAVVANANPVTARLSLMFLARPIIWNSRRLGSPASARDEYRK